MIFGYINETQQDKIKEKILKLESKGILRDNIFIERDNIKKTKYKELLNCMKQYDNLIIIDITEVTTTKQLCNLIQFLAQKELKIVLGELVLDFTQKDNLIAQGMVQMSNTILNFEKKLLGNRIKKEVNKAKEKGKKLGRPRLTIDNLPEIVKKIYPLYESGVIGATEFANKCNMSRPRIINYIKLIEVERNKINEEDL